jgi:predicted TIM-barrel fold metal-dependent hydrolase
MPRAIDTFVNVNMGSIARPEWLQRVAEDYFNRADVIFNDIAIPELIEAMDRASVQKCVLTTEAEDPSEHVLSFPRAHPDRFVLSLSLDPRSGMSAIRALTRLAAEQPVALARITPFIIGLPPTDRVYYPVYSKCIELDLPIAINTGLPGPPMPGKCQDPMYLDEVCVFYPELKVSWLTAPTPGGTSRSA